MKRETVEKMMDSVGCMKRNAISYHIKTDDLKWILKYQQMRSDLFRFEDIKDIKRNECYKTPARCAIPADITALHTMMGKQQFCEDPTARNSNRLPQKGKGAVRFRSSTFASMCWAALQPVSSSNRIR